MTPARPDTTIPTTPSAVKRQLQSVLHLQYGVAGKEARCPGKQGEVSPLNLKPLHGCPLPGRLVPAAVRAARTPSVRRAPGFKLLMRSLSAGSDRIGS